MKRKKDDVVAARQAELAAIEDEQERIDRVAHDLSTGTNRYAVLDADTLAQLLGVYFDDAACGSWSHIQYAYRTNPEDEVHCVFPLAENVDLLEDKIEPKRYARLAKRAGTIIATGRGGDLTLTAREERLLRYEYQLKHCGDDGPTLASKTLLATSGVKLRFEATLADGYLDDGAWSPYDLNRGEGFDSSEYFNPEFETDADWPLPNSSRKRKKPASPRKVVNKRMKRPKRQKAKRRQ